MHEETLAGRRIYDGRVLKLDLVDVRLADGTCSQREIVRNRGAAAVLARADDGNFLLVRQFRKPLDRECLEIIAGLLEDGESHEDCARRELLEETGYRVRNMRPLGRLWSSPGFSDEEVALFFAEVTSAGVTSQERDERVEPVMLSGDELERLILGGQGADGKTVAAWLLFRYSPDSAGRGKGNEIA